MCFLSCLFSGRCLLPFNLPLYRYGITVSSWSFKSLPPRVGVGGGGCVAVFLQMECGFQCSAFCPDNIPFRLGARAFFLRGGGGVLLMSPCGWHSLQCRQLTAFMTLNENGILIASSRCDSSDWNELLLMFFFFFSYILCFLLSSTPASWTPTARGAFHGRHTEKTERRLGQTSYTSFILDRSST